MTDNGLFFFFSSLAVSRTPAWCVIKARGESCDLIL